MTNQDNFCTDVTGACFQSADLRGADLSQMRGLTIFQISQAIIDETTKLPPELVRLLPPKGQ